MKRDEVMGYHPVKEIALYKFFNIVEKLNMSSNSSNELMHRIILDPIFRQRLRVI